MKRRKQKNSNLPVYILALIAVVLTVVLAVMLLLLPEPDSRMQQNTPPNTETTMETEPGEETTAERETIAADEQKDDQTEAEETVTVAQTAPQEDLPEKDTATEPENDIPEDTIPTQPVPSQTEGEHAASTEPAATVAEEPETSKPTETSPMQTEPEESPADSVPVRTSTVTLYFPIEWKDHMLTRISETEDDTVITFLTVVGNEEIPLFGFHFGGVTGDPVGKWENDSGVVVDVTLEMFDVEMKESWSTEETDRICAIQESVNFIMEKLAQNERYHPL